MSVTFAPNFESYMWKNEYSFIEEISGIKRNKFKDFYSYVIKFKGAENVTDTCSEVSPKSVNAKGNKYLKCNDFGIVLMRNDK